MTASSTQSRTPIDIDWGLVADEVAARLAVDVVERDRVGGTPRAEVELLRTAGLLPLIVSTERGGHGQSWFTAFDVVSRLARVDASVGHLLGYHYLHSWRTRLARRTEVVERLDRDSASGAWFWGGAGNPRDAALVLEPVTGGYLVRGKKFFATGAAVSQRVVAGGTIGGDGPDAGTRLGFAIPTDTPGVSHGYDWDALGQRMSASGSITFDGAFLSHDDVLGPAEQTDAGAPAYPSLSGLGFQAILSILATSLAEGALREAAAYTTARSRPWTPGLASATEDPLIRVRYGELAASARAARALTDRAAAAWVAATERGWDLSGAERGAVSVELGAAKVVTTAVSLDVTSGVFEVTGARATATGTGLDRYWRDARTLTLHDPVAMRATEVGDHLLTGALPVPNQCS